ncbi:MAG: hypothetical protein ACOX6N_00525 [Patescibacteria group bacterium]|jgi:hypothetical protein
MERTIGFSPVKEKEFLLRVEASRRRRSLEAELSTQLAEDFGLVKFSKTYDIRGGKIVDPVSGLGVVDITRRYSIKEESEAIEAIEKGLERDPLKMWVYFSPRNEELNYTDDCIDFWRRVEGQIKWNRIVVRQGFGEMREIRKQLGGQGEVTSRLEILGKPVQTGVKMAEVMERLRIAGTRGGSVGQVDVQAVVSEAVNSFYGSWKNDLYGDEKAILGLYSYAFRQLEARARGGAGVSDEMKMEYIAANFVGMEAKRSFGCSGSTMVAEVTGRGYFIAEVSGVRKVIYGNVPEGYKLCKKCGLYYSGDSCPFCS